ncbi:hypothetical protein [Paracoccus sp. 22332]|uniref:hypothetical protein n=1 Tax=Paracoccus sp. 22332 TaxID=3453913 RepID=UPI003F84E8BF
MTDTSTLRERIAIAISGAPFPSKQSLAKADRVLAIIDAQTEQPDDLQLSAHKVGSAPQDQTGVSTAPDAVAEARDRPRCHPENYASGTQCASCGSAWREDGPDECPLEPLT